MHTRDAKDARGREGGRGGRAGQARLWLLQGVSSLPHGPIALWPEAARSS